MGGITGADLGEPDVTVVTDVVDLSRLQFAVTALYHFLFVPLTLGLSWILVIMESVYVMTGRQIYRDMTRFWGLLYESGIVTEPITHEDDVDIDRAQQATDSSS